MKLSQEQINNISKVIAGITLTVVVSLASYFGYCVYSDHQEEARTERAFKAMQEINKIDAECWRLAMDDACSIIDFQEGDHEVGVKELVEWLQQDEAISEDRLNALKDLRVIESDNVSKGFSSRQWRVDMIDAAIAEYNKQH